jgi:transposase-like protein
MFDGSIENRQADNGASHLDRSLSGYPPELVAVVQTRVRYLKEIDRQQPIAITSKTTRNMHKSKKLRINQANGGSGLQGGSGKAVVMGVLQRGGKVVASVIPDRSRASMQPIIRGVVEPGSQIHSDEWAANYRMDDEYTHNVVNHLAAYVDGNVHTNGMENFWSLLKRTIGGTYVSVEPFHLFRYVDEQAFRFNNRLPMGDAERFSYLVRKIVGKRLTYAQLTGKTGTATPDQTF